MTQDMAPSVTQGAAALPADLDLAAYAESVLERFANPATGHLTIQVAMDGSQKLPIRLLSAARERLAAGADAAQIARAVGAWTAFVTLRRDRTGRPLEVSDPMLATIDEALAGNEAGRVDRLLGIEAVFGTDLAAHDDFRADVYAADAELTAR